MQSIDTLLSRSSVHAQWKPLLKVACQEIDSSYLDSLVSDPDWLPGSENLFAAFRRDRENVQYLLFGESPYPRAESANGISFYDAAVNELWSPDGLSKPVNRATSLRNIIKTILVAEGHLVPDSKGKISQPLIASVDKSRVIQTIAELFDALHHKGFLMMNATPVLHPERKPRKEAQFWRGFLQAFLQQLLSITKRSQLPILVLWGKIAEQIQSIPCAAEYPQLICEHPYNISFIDNPQMQQLFQQLELLRRSDT